MKSSARAVFAWCCCIIRWPNKVAPGTTSDALVEYVVAKGVKLIGVDAAGVQKPKKHAAVDQYCADRGVFIIENLNNVKTLLGLDKPFTVYTAPLSRTDLTGLPCRVLAEVD